MQEVKEKINMELLINKHMEKEKTKESSNLKKEFIMELINKKIKYIDAINYYYDIVNLNNTKD